MSRPVIDALRYLTLAALCVAWSLPVIGGGDKPRHGLAIHGEPALHQGFSSLPYANPEAPKGGRLVLGLQGTFDSLNPLVVKGVAPDAVTRFVWQSMMARSLDEPFTMYGLVASSVEYPADRSVFTFNLDPRARFSDGRPLTSEDVRFTFELLLERGKPFHRSAFGQIRSVRTEGPHRIRFDVTGVEDRELPLLIALMPILPAHATDAAGFEDTTLTPPIGSGPYAVTEVRPGERLVMTRRTDYWGWDLPTMRGLFNFDEIRYDFYRDANSLFEAFKAGLYDYRVETDASRWVAAYDFPAIRDGRVRKEAIPLKTPRGMNGLVFNTRRTLFSDPKIREALSLVFDFDWLNRNLFFGQLARSDSYFAASELSSVGTPASEAERALLADYAATVREDILEGRWSPPLSDGSGRDRDLARRSLDLLREAGWEIRDGALRRADTDEVFAFEILVTNRAQERIALNYAASLARIGITARTRLVDDVQYWRRLAAFDFDMIQWTWPASLSPGNEQRNRWGSEAAGRNGSLNFAGASSPAIDGMIDALLAAKTRDQFVAAVRALDRVLLSGFYVVPLFHLPDQWVAHDAKLKHPQNVPLLGLPVELWWREPD